MEIPLSESLNRLIPIYLMLAEKEAAGPATRALADIIINDRQATSESGGNATLY